MIQPNGVFTRHSLLLALLLTQRTEAVVWRWGELECTQLQDFFIWQRHHVWHGLSAYCIIDQHHMASHHQLCGQREPSVTVAQRQQLSYNKRHYP